MPATYSELHFDALREVANIGSSTAATSLSSMIGIPVEVSSPRASAMALAEAIEYLGPGETVVTSILIPVVGDLDAIVLMVLRPSTEEAACRLMRVERDTEVGESALLELGNILGASYLGALVTLTDMRLEPTPPEMVRDMFAAALASALLIDVREEVVFVLESTLAVASQEFSPTFLFVPTRGSVDDILERLHVRNS
jgi:chemotaxis protein CheC